MKNILIRVLFLIFTISLSVVVLSSCSHKHNFIMQIANDSYIASNATCGDKATYYYSCECGERGAETFEYGEALGHGFNEDNYCECGEYNWGLAFTYNNGAITGLTDIGRTLKQLKIPESINNENIIAIGKNAFEGCWALTNIEIPNSVTSIGDFAFMGCTSLQNIKIPDGVTHIGANAFDHCIKLASIAISNSVINIAVNAFSSCTSLTNIVVDNGNPYYCSIEGNLFSKDRKTLVYYAIGKIQTSFTVPNSVTCIGNSAFSGGVKLMSVAIPNSVISIGNYAFSSCTSLTSIEIPNSVTSIGMGAFLNCSSLTSIEIPNSITSFNDNTFSNCVSLKSIVIPTSVTNIGESVFASCTSLESVVIPNSVTSVGELAFYGCSSIRSVKIPRSVIEIGAWAFVNCPNLTIYCRATSKPSGWDDKWNAHNFLVVWNYVG